MALDITVKDQFDNTGQSSYDLSLYVRSLTRDIPNTRSAYAWELSVIHTGGSGGRWQGANVAFGVQIGGQSFYPTNVLDMRGQSSRVIGSDTTQFFGHDANGYLNLPVRAWVNNVTSFGSADARGTLSADRIPVTPGPIRNLSASALSYSSGRAVFAGPAENGGSAVTAYVWQLAKSSSFSGASSGAANLSGTIDFTGLEADTTYYVRVRARNDVGDGLWSSAVTFKTPTGLPNAPSGITRSFEAPTTYEVSWPEPTTTNGGGSVLEYQIQRALNSSFTESLGTYSTGTSRSWSASSHTLGETYYYRVRARAGGGWGDWSGTFSFTFPNVPGTPALSSLTFVAPSRLDAEWGIPATNGASILEYQTQIATNSSFTSATTASVGTSRSRSFTVSDGVQYWVRVRARNSQGWGSWSAAQSYSVPNVPSAPALDPLTFAAPDGLLASWSAPNNNGASILEYEIQKSTDAAFTSPVVASTGTARSRELTAVTNEQYWVRVRARNSQGWGSWSNVRTYTTPNVPSAPGLSTLTFDAPDSLRASWTAPNNNGASILEYQAQLSTTSGFTSGVSTVSAGTGSTWVFTVSSNDQYWVRVRARNSQGWGPWSTVRSYTTPTTPSGVTITAISSNDSAGNGVLNQAVLEAAASNSGGASVYEFQYERATNSTFTEGVTTFTAGSTGAATSSGLAPGTTYYFRVRARNSQGYSSWSPTRSLAIPNVPSTPVTPSAIASAGQIEMSWNAPANNGSAIIQYEVRTGTTSRGTSTTTSKTIIGLTPGAYSVSVRARNAMGWSSWSAARTVTVPTTPAAPNLTAVSLVSGTSARVTFTAPTSDGGSPITSYQVESATNTGFTSGLTTRSVSAAGAHTITTGLNPGSLYYWRVRAVSAVGSGAWSNVRSLLQGTAAPNPPSIAVTASVVGTSAYLQLGPPANTGGLPITEYRVTAQPVTSENVAQDSAIVRTMTGSGSFTGLIPGQRYRWSAIAINVAGDSPSTAFTYLTQPRPNTSPGDFFDGSTAAGDDVTYSWSGTENLSTSLSTGVGVSGWSCNQRNANAAQARMIRVSGGRYGTYSALATVFRDSVGDGLRVGMSSGARSSVSPFTTYTASAWVRVSRTQRIGLMVVWHNDAGAQLLVEYGGDRVVQADTWTRITWTLTSPPGAASAYHMATDISGTGWVPFEGGDTFQVDAIMLNLGEEVTYFDGATKDTTLYRYDWVGTANASESTRTTLDQAYVDPLADPDCPPLPIPPRAPVIVGDCIDEVGVWRRYWLTVPSTEVGRWVSSVPTLTLEVGGVAAQQVRIRYFQNPDDLEPSQYIETGWESEQLIAYIPANTKLVIDGVSERVFATVDGADEAIAADRLLYGSGGVPPTWPVMGCGSSYLIAFDVPLNAPLGNINMTIGLTRRMG